MRDFNSSILQFSYCIEKHKTWVAITYTRAIIYTWAQPKEIKSFSRSFDLIDEVLQFIPFASAGNYVPEKCFV